MLKKLLLLAFVAAAFVVLSQVPSFVPAAQAARPTPAPPPVATPAPSATPVSAP